MKRVPLALQLFSLHKEMKRDWKATLAAVHEMGYQGVEFFGA